MSTASAPLLRLEQITKRFKGVTAVDGVNLDVNPGEKLVIIGPSGSGKSTLLRTINFLEIIDDGRVWFDGREVGYVRRHGRPHLDRQQAVCQVRAEIGMVFQHFHLFPHLTVLGNVMEGPLTVQKKGKEEARETAMAMLAKVGLIDKKDVYPATLSGGQKQRVAIARALANDPDILLMDEPTGNLDSAAEAEVLEAVGNLHRQGKTVIIVTHNPEIARRAELVIEIRDGRVARTERAAAEAESVAA